MHQTVRGKSTRQYGGSQSIWRRICAMRIEEKVYKARRQKLRVNYLRHSTTDLLQDRIAFIPLYTHLSDLAEQRRLRDMDAHSMSIEPIPCPAQRSTTFTVWLNKPLLSSRDIHTPSWILPVVSYLPATEWLFIYDGLLQKPPASHQRR